MARLGVGGLVATTLVGLLLPPTASAHVRSGIAAADYEVRVAPLPAALASAAAVKAHESDRSLSLTVRNGHTVVVLDSQGRPFIRIDSSDPSYTWHDDRLRGLPDGVDRGSWAVPLVVDGERVALRGELERVDAPPIWPWVVLAGAVAGLTAVALMRGRPARLVQATVGFGVMAAAATIALAVGFAVDPNASGATWLESANAALLALVGLAVVAFGSRAARIAASGLLGLLGIFAAVTKLEILNHGIVLSALPAAPTRAAVVLALSAGAAAIVLSFLAFEGSLAAD